MVPCHITFVGLTFSTTVDTLHLSEIPQKGDLIYFHTQGDPMIKGVSYPSGHYRVVERKLCINACGRAFAFYSIKAKLEKQDDEGKEGGVR